MKKIQRNNREYWVGCHETVGLVIYDPVAQREVADSYVRLFKVEEKRMSTFSKEIIKQYLIPCNSYFHQNEMEPKRVPEELESAVAFYSELRSRSRMTHCYNCKRDLDSVDFAVCAKCGWIKCTCGACGCGFYRASEYEH